MQEKTTRDKQAQGNPTKTAQQAIFFTSKLNAEIEEFHVEHVPLSLGKVIQQARQAKEWTQNELGAHVNEKVKVIKEYESAKAIPNTNILAKMERALGVKLRGKDIGQPLAAPVPKKK
uniref:HTH cro/C1-type domain-containing protein n=1 Tax=Ditylenchus dipsaci TaxID=166011 RepID=A0A915DIY8_9BILA